MDNRCKCRIKDCLMCEGLINIPHMLVQGLEQNGPRVFKEQKFGIEPIPDEIINKALTHVESIPYYNCEHPCSLVLRGGIEWCNCEEHELPHPSLFPGSPDYLEDYVACMRVARILKLMVVFNPIDGHISIRPSISKPSIKRKIIDPDNLAGTLALMLYEHIQKMGK